jgi:uncharacterized protein (DUF1501 family)
MNVTRRDFLKRTLGASTVVSFGSAIPSFLSGTALAGGLRPSVDGTVLVVVQLTGGNDGLNTVVPFQDDTYARSRPTLCLGQKDVHRIHDSLGFHPDLEAFLRLYEDDRLCVIQGVGYPHSSRDHDAAMRDWHTARPGQAECHTGWVGRLTDCTTEPSGSAVPSFFVGPIARPFALNAEASVVPAIHALRESRIRSFPDTLGGKEHREAMERLAALPRDSSRQPVLDGLRRVLADAIEKSRRVEEALEKTAARGTYPDYGLARDLRTTAQIIRADVGVRVVFTELGGGGIGGFDSHANQAANHGALLRQLSRSVHAFLEDLEQDGLLGRVLLLTFSEFGRTVLENGRRGTDHGAAAPVFLAGSRVRAGLCGEHPSLDDLDAGGLKHHTDFRSVYATVLEKWLGVDPLEVLGEKYETLDVVAGSVGRRRR